MGQDTSLVQRAGALSVVLSRRGQRAGTKAGRRPDQRSEKARGDPRDPRRFWNYLDGKGTEGGPLVHAPIRRTYSLGVWGNQWYCECERSSCRTVEQLGWWFSECSRDVRRWHAVGGAARGVARGALTVLQLKSSKISNNNWLITFIER